jgi:hypothetical protein
MKYKEEIIISAAAVLLHKQLISFEALSALLQSHCHYYYCHQEEEELSEPISLL